MLAGAVSDAVAAAPPAYESVRSRVIALPENVREGDDVGVAALDGTGFRCLTPILGQSRVIVTRVMRSPPAQERQSSAGPQRRGTSDDC